MQYHYFIFLMTFLKAWKYIKVSVLNSIPVYLYKQNASMGKFCPLTLEWREEKLPPVNPVSTKKKV